ncbi:hypothetical protein GCM10018962_28260 [Dactylosporangium matsuzakiense]|uniref:Uncharacterized protein n=1 Tax=Dactylosporangium matsuzakiense TaxID=53360 RepID=A0A9W6NN08_9ACTN|nr:hypothetical protein GCM10017581_047410 [Dactylosporangium matsuzakiense]
MRGACECRRAHDAALTAPAPERATLAAASARSRWLPGPSRPRVAGWLPGPSRPRGSGLLCPRAVMVSVSGRMLPSHP